MMEGLIIANIAIICVSDIVYTTKELLKAIT